MIDALQENVISIPTAARLFSVEGSHPDPRTLWRWAQRGCGNPRVYLELIRVGGKTYTSREAVSRFLAALNRKPQSTSTPRQKSWALQQAERELAAAGV